jgi:hypothetical protein
MTTGTFSEVDEDGDCMSASFVDGEHLVVFPVGGRVGPLPESVPTAVADAFKEAAKVVELSPNATAVLARRALQVVLRLQGVPEGRIAEEIAAAREGVPPGIAGAMDALRDVSAAGAHPSFSQGAVVDISEREAMDILRALWVIIEHFYPPAEEQEDPVARMIALREIKGQRALRRRQRDSDQSDGSED